jgi:trk system potassium uptake protein TrkA
LDFGFGICLGFWILKLSFKITSILFGHNVSNNTENFKFKPFDLAFNMYIVIAGAGKVGYAVAKSLITAGHNIAIIDNAQKSCDEAEGLDAMVIKGNAASPAIQENANIGSADFFIGITGSDEINMVSCGFAKSNGCKTIARINNLDYIESPIEREKFKRFGVDTAVCPDLVAAINMNRILAIPSLSDVSPFAGGKIKILNSRIEDDASVIGKPIKKINFPARCNVAVIFRENNVIVPEGDDTFFSGDRVVTVVGKLDDISKLEKLFGTYQPNSNNGTVRKVMIIGASRIGLHLARALASKGLNVVLIEESQENCQQASEHLPNVLVINGNGTNRELLLDEGIKKVDAFLATTNQDETNILSCLLAKQYGAKKTIALVDRPGLKSVLEDAGIDLAVSPRLTTVSTILKYVHRPELLSVNVLRSGEAEIIEMKLTNKSKIVGKTLKKAKLPRHSLVCAVSCLCGYS